MEGSFLTPAEQHYYPELFSYSDTEGAGRVAAQRAMSLFLSSQLSTDIIQRINELCGAARLGYYGRSQFYCALKMIAMVQNGLPLPTSLDFITKGIDVPLPAFGQDVPRHQGETDASGQMEFVNPAFNITDLEFTLGDKKAPKDWPGGTAIPNVQPPQPSRPANSSSYIQPQIPQSPTHQAQPPSSPPVSPSQSPPSFTTGSQVQTSPGRSTGSLERNHSLPTSAVLAESSKDGSSRLEKQASEPVPSLTKTDEGWASFDKQRQEAQEDTSWAKFPSPAVSPSSSSSSLSAPASHPTSESPVDSRSAVDEGQEGDVEPEEEEEEDVWLITKELRDYYTNQFKMLQPDPNGLLPGVESKGYFEKSKLPTEELSKIWQLSDVNKDGTLSLEEFCTAMHLVVLRKHNIPLPDELPSCLIPKMEMFNGEGVAPAKPTNQSQVSKQPITTTTIHPIQPHAHAGRSVTPPSSESEIKNADDDAKIFQPIALHLSPDGKPVPPEAEASESRPRTFSDPVHQESPEEDEESKSPMKPRSMTIGNNSTDHTPAKIAPPPEWEKSSSIPSPRPTIPPRPTAQQMQQSKTMSMDVSTTEHDFADFSKFEPLKTKSSSLKAERRVVSMDYNTSHKAEQPFPPLPPPRPTPSEEDIAEDSGQAHLAPDTTATKERHLSGDSDHADKKREQFSKERTRHMSAPVPLGVAELRSGDRKSVQARIRSAKEENTKLSRHNSEMQQELRTLTDQRLALEIQLERLRPFSNTAS